LTVSVKKEELSKEEGPVSDLNEALTHVLHTTCCYPTEVRNHAAVLRSCDVALQACKQHCVEYIAIPDMSMHDTATPLDCTVTSCRSHRLCFICWVQESGHDRMSK